VNCVWRDPEHRYFLELLPCSAVLNLCDMTCPRTKPAFSCPTPSPWLSLCCTHTSAAAHPSAADSNNTFFCPFCCPQSCDEGVQAGGAGFWWCGQVCSCTFSPFLRPSPTLPPSLRPLTPLPHAPRTHQPGRAPPASTPDSCFVCIKASCARVVTLLWLLCQQSNDVLASLWQLPPHPLRGRPSFTTTKLRRHSRPLPPAPAPWAVLRASAGTVPLKSCIVAPRCTLGSRLTPLNQARTTRVFFQR
jgi:hypothetical protein